VRPARKSEEGRVEAAGCTTNRWAPTVDVVVAGLQAFRTLFALSLTDMDYQGMTLTRSTDIGIGVAMTTLFATSMAYGFATTGTCREATGSSASPYSRAPLKKTRAQQRQDEAAEEAAVQARARARAAAAQSTENDDDDEDDDAGPPNAKAAADAKAAGEGARRSAP